MKFRPVALLLLVLLMVAPNITIHAAERQKSVLLITSYSVTERRVANTVTEFKERCDELGVTAMVHVESLECQNFMEMREWKDRITDIFDQYTGNNLPDVLVLWGQEAAAAYRSLDRSKIPDVPVVSANMSRTMIDFPADTVNLRTWMPTSRDRLDNLHNYPNIKYSFYYDYDIVSNIDLIKMFYPKTQNIAFISDCSYGGVVMQALVRKEMEGFPELKLILIDGRVNTLYTAISKLKSLPKNTAVILGTSWRTDMSGDTFSSNRLYDLLDSDIKLPVFTCAAVGLGYGSIGGVMPKFRPLGREMADGAVQYLEHPDMSYNKITLIPTKCILDYGKVGDMGLDLNGLPYDIEEINHPMSFYAQYKTQIWTGVAGFLFLLLAIVALLYTNIRVRKMNDKLVESQDELRQAKEKAEESNRLKSAFLANMSHEIRTPLNAIVGFTDVITLGGLSHEEMAEYNAIINSNASLLLHLINDILDLSRLEAGRDKLELSRFDIVSLSRMALDSVAVSNEKGLTYNFECAKSSFTLNTDIHRLRQVITNLLTNAYKFTDKGSITLKIDFDDDKRRVLFSVTDTGCGIPLEKQKLVFQRFEKISEYTQGAGLGLSICQLIVTKLGGEIWVDPDYTDGARFVFSHPMGDENNNEEVADEVPLMKD